MDNTVIRASATDPRLPMPTDVAACSIALLFDVPPMDEYSCARAKSSLTCGKKVRTNATARPRRA